MHAVSRNLSERRDIREHRCPPHHHRFDYRNRRPLPNRRKHKHVERVEYVGNVKALPEEMHTVGDALLTAEAIGVRGLNLAGWVGNSVDPDFQRRELNMDTLRSRLAANCLGCFPYSPATATPGPSPEFLFLPDDAPAE